MSAFVPALFVSFAIGTSVQRSRFGGAGGFETGPAYLLVLILLVLAVLIYFGAAFRGQESLRAGAGGTFAAFALALVFAWLMEG